MKKIVLGIFVTLIVLLGAGFYIFKTNFQQAQPTYQAFRNDLNRSIIEK